MNILDDRQIDQNSWSWITLIGQPHKSWRDLEGPIFPRESGLGKPTFATYRGNIKAYAFAANDIADIIFHWPHDWVPKSDTHLHIHWSHNGTAISGSLVMSYRWTFAKGHNQEIFPAETAIGQTVSTPNVATIPQYIHRIDEIQFSADSPTGGQINNTALEVDGLLLVNLTPTTIPTVTGGSFFIHYVDIHYQSQNVGTRNKAPNFYT